MEDFDMYFLKVLFFALICPMICHLVQAGAVADLVSRLKFDTTNETIIVLVPGGWNYQRSLAGEDKRVLTKAIVLALQKKASKKEHKESQEGTNFHPPSVASPALAPSICIYGFDRLPTKAGRYSNDDTFIWRVSAFDGLGFYIENRPKRGAAENEFVMDAKGADEFLAKLRRR